MTESSPLESLRTSLAPRYEVDCEVGRGGMATVYRAIDTQSDSREVAVKVLMPELAAAVGADRFRREVEIASTLDHPRILSAIDAGTTNDSLYLVMPFVRGESLRDRIRRERQLPVADAVTIAREVADALAYAHARGFVHRDVKPENILLQADGHAVVADFGIARVITQNVDADTLTRTGVAVGTPLYMSPEQSAAERTIDGRSDEYSLGCVLYEMLVGEPPFTGNSTQMLMARHAMEPVPSVRVVRDAVPEHVEDAIFRAMEKAPADRFPTVEAFATALGDVDDWRFRNPTRGTRSRRGRGARPWWRRRPGRRALMAGGALAAVAVAGVAAWRRGGTTDGPPTPVVTIAVAPFNPLRPELKLWQEGMVDVMARNLDAVGPLRSVNPAVVMRGWTGKADRASAHDLGKRTSARFALFGSLTTTPGGGVRVSARLLDVATDSISPEFTRDGTDAAALGDSLTLFVVGELSKKFAIGAVRRTTPFSRIGIGALRSFLEGEQAYRRTAWAEALGSYRRAIALDTGFALALHRIGQVVVWQSDAADSLGRDASLRAGALNHGLDARDSLLIAADSQSAALYDPRTEVPNWALLQRLFATLGTAAARYPGDPEVWYAVGEARHHHGYGVLTNVSEQSVLDAFDRAIALDSGFAPAYIHAVLHGFVLHGRDRGRRYAEAYLALRPTDTDAAGIRLVEILTDPKRTDSLRIARALDTASTGALFSAEEILSRWPDSAFTATTVIRTVARRPRDAPTHAEDSLLVQQYLPLTLAYRGRMREAYEALGNRRSRLFAEMALLGGLEPDTANAVFARWLASDAPQAQLALPWWAERGDSASIRALGRRAEERAKGAGPTGYISARYTAATARAYLDLSRRTAADSTRAIETLRQLSDTVCLTCYFDRFVLARLLVARGQDREARGWLRQRLYTAITPTEIAIALERGRVSMRLRDTTDARRAFALVVAAWAGGDQEVQPAVTEARGALRGVLPSIARGAPATPTLSQLVAR